MLACNGRGRTWFPWTDWTNTSPRYSYRFRRPRPSFVEGGGQEILRRIQLWQWASLLVGARIVTFWHRGTYEVQSLSVSTVHWNWLVFIPLSRKCSSVQLLFLQVESLRSWFIMLSFTLSSRAQTVSVKVGFVSVKGLCVLSFAYKITIAPCVFYIKLSPIWSNCASTSQNQVENSGN